MSMALFPSLALFVWNNTLAVWLAARWGRRLLPTSTVGGPSGAAERALATTVLFLAIAVGSLQLLGFLGLLTVYSVAGLLGALVLLELLTRTRVGSVAPAEAVERGPASVAPEDGNPGSRTGAIAGKVVVGIVCAYCAWLVLTTGVHFGWDTQTYHAVAPAWWYQQGSLEIPPFNYQGYYPLNVELVSLWFLMPFGTDAHVSLAMFGWVALLVAAAGVHARILGQSPVLTAIVLGTFLLTPPVQERLVYYTSGDISLSAVLLALLALAWVPRDADGDVGGSGAVTRRALLCGLAGGIALGMKSTAAPIVLIVGLWWLWRLGWGRAAVRPLLAYSGAVLALGSAWYLRNLALTGNPLFPAELGPFEGPFDAAAQRSTKLLPVLLERGGELSFWSELFQRYLDWPLPVGVAAVVGYAVGIWACLRTRDRWLRAHLVTLLLCGAVALAVYPLQPFSGRMNRPNGPLFFSPRFITLAVLVGLVLLPCVRLAPRGAASAVARSRRPAWLLPAAVALISLGAGLATPARMAATAEQLGHFGQGNFGDVWEAVDRLPDGARVAVLSRDPPSHALVYPLFGRQLQLEPVAINGDGRPREPLHEVWRDRPGDWWWEFGLDPVDQAAVLADNLRATGVDFLVLNRWPPPQPSERSRPFLPRWARSGKLDPERRIYADQDSEIWDLRPDSRAAGSPLKEGTDG